jgi:hypothetical protein
MLRTVDMVLIGLMAAAATITYQIKHYAEEKLAHVRYLEAQVQMEEQTIDLLRADWSLLNQPSRMQQLTERFEEDLGLATIESTQIATIDELPAKLLQIEELIAEPLEGFTEPTITGALLR